MPHFGSKDSLASRNLQLHLSHQVGEESEEAYHTDVVVKELSEADAERWLDQRQSICKWNYKRSRNEENNKARTARRAAAGEIDINLDQILIDI